MTGRRGSRERVARAACLIVGALGVAALAGACGGDDDTEALRRARLSEGCIINTDCVSPLVCAFRRCHTQCKTTRDCPPTQRCVASDKPFNVCQLDDERDCNYNSECSGGQLCAIDGQCRDQCAGDRDCVSGQVCTTGTCAEPSELEDGRLKPAPGMDAGGAPCTYNSECPAPLVCRAGRCAAECLGDVDCDPGEHCEGSRCLAGAPDGGACVYDSDCGGNGQVCRSGTCRCECKTSVDCSAGATCDGCGCVRPRPDGAPPGWGDPCSLPSDCPTPLVCSSISATCAFECGSNIDCPLAGTCCVENRCVTGAACGSSDAGTDACVVCSYNLQCDDEKWCNGAERCANGCCAPALEVPCDSHSACITDQCDEANRTCSQTQITPEDVDKDGQLSPGCGGLDCDDQRADVFTGALEKCDGVDNDCNGTTDDHSRAPFGAVRQGPVSAVTSPTSGAVAPFGSGFIGVYSSGVTIQAEKLDAAGAVTKAATQLFTGSNTSLLVDDLTAETNTALVLFQHGASASLLSAILVDANLAQIARHDLATFGSFNESADAVWTGSEYFVVWPEDFGTYTQGNVARILPNGTLTNASLVPTDDGTGHIREVAIRAAHSGSTFAALYQYGSGIPESAVAIFSASGGLLAGPIKLAPPNSNPIAIAGTPGGYVAVYGSNPAKATFIAQNGTVGASVTVPLTGVPTTGDGASDSGGALFGLGLMSQAPRFGYAVQNLARPFELGIALTPGNPTGITNIAGFGTRFAISHFVNAKVNYVSVGCQ
jgi:hypothetical protein